jgi:large subunit ribosomal protein L6
MSRVGKKIIILPDGVTVDKNGNNVTVKGSLGSLQMNLLDGIEIHQEDKSLTIAVNEKFSYADMAKFHGLTRALIGNMVTGVSQGFIKDLEIVGVGYRATQQNQSVQFQLGYSHHIIFDPPQGINVEVLEATKVRVKGIDKQKVGQVAANIRKLRPPEPYKGKGIKYKDEQVRKKAGKTGK